MGSGDDISSTSESLENGLMKSANNEYNNSNTSPESTLERGNINNNPMETKQLEIVATQLLSLKADIEVRIEGEKKKIFYMFLGGRGVVRSKSGQKSSKLVFDWVK